MTRVFIVLPFVLLSAALSEAAPARPGIEAPISRELCPSLTLARRRGSEGCWVSYRDGNPAAETCVTRALWLSELRREDGALCGRFEGRWKDVRPPQPAGSDEAKRAWPRFVAERRADRRADEPTNERAPGAGESSASGPAAPWIQRVARRALLSVERLRERISAQLARPDADPTALLRRLLLDEASPSAAPALLRQLGFVHLLTATGIHLYALAALVAAAIGWAFSALGSLHPACASVRVATALRRALVAGAWTLAWALCGARAGMLRPLALVSVRAQAQRAGYRWRRWFPLALSLAVDALAALARGRSPSSAALVYALAVGGGMMAVAAERAEEAPGTMRPAFALGAVLSHLRLAVGSWLPVALWELGTGAPVSIATPWLSLVTLPLFAQLLFPACLIAIASGHLEWLAPIGALLSRALAIACEAAFSLKALWIAPRAGLLLGATLAAAGLAARAARRPRRERAARGGPVLHPEIPGRASGLLPIALLAAMLAWPGDAAPSGPPRGLPARVRQLDVGQGDAALIVDAQGRAGLIDVGPSRALGPGEWVAALARAGVRGVDWVALTHLDEDHVGGLAALAAVAPVGCVASARDELAGTRGAGIREIARRSAIPLTSWSAGCVPYPVSDPELRPPSAGPHGGHNGRMGGALAWLRGGGVYVSLGDAEGGDELAMLRDLEPALARAAAAGPRILKVSHHGSRTSSDPEFLARLRPTEAWISVGAGNSYGHPAATTLERLGALEIPVRRTDVEGALASDAIP